jgi:Family of unknown function (DUF6441)
MNLIDISIDGASGDLAAAMQGRLDAVVAARVKTVETGMTAAMGAVVKRAVTDLRADIAAGGFSNLKLTKTWHGQTLPGGKPVMDPAGWLWNKAPTLLDAFSNGVTITVKNAQFLAIPQGPAKGIVARLNQAGNRTRNGFGRFAREENPVARVAAELGVELVAHIDQATGKGVLVAASPTRLTPRGRLAKRQTGANTVLFVLVKQATLRPRIKGRAMLDEIAARAPGEITSEVASQLAGSDVSA